MQTVNIHEAKTHLSRLVERAWGKIPDDFDTMYADEIAHIFNGGD